MKKENVDKIKKFYSVLERVQVPPAKDIGMIITKKEELDEIVNLAPNSNTVSSMIIDGKTPDQQIIDQLAEGLKGGKTIVIGLGEFLSPKVFNQLYLLTKNGGMQYPNYEEWVRVTAPKEANIMLVISQQDLDKLNYQNIFDLVGPVERL